MLGFRNTHMKYLCSVDNSNYLNNQNMLVYCLRQIIKKCLQMFKRYLEVELCANINVTQLKDKFKTNYVRTNLMSN